VSFRYLQLAEQFKIHQGDSNRVCPQANIGAPARGEHARGNRRPRRQTRDSWPEDHGVAATSTGSCSLGAARSAPPFRRRESRTETQGPRRSSMLTARTPRTNESTHRGPTLLQPQLVATSRIDRSLSRIAYTSPRRTPTPQRPERLNAPGPLRPQGQHQQRRPSVDSARQRLPVSAPTSARSSDRVVCTTSPNHRGDDHERMRTNVPAPSPAPAPPATSRSPSPRELKYRNGALPVTARI